MSSMKKCLVCENKIGANSKHKTNKKLWRVTCCPECAKIYYRISNYLSVKNARKNGKVGKLKTKPNPKLIKVKMYGATKGEKA